MNHSYVVYSVYTTLKPHSSEVYSALAFGSGNLHCKLPLSLILGLCICGIHHVTIMYYIFCQILIEHYHISLLHLLTLVAQQ